MLKNRAVESVKKSVGSIKYRPVQPFQPGSLAFSIKCAYRLSVRFLVEPADPVQF